MKITIDSNTAKCMVGSKTYEIDLPENKKWEVNKTINKFITNNIPLSEFEYDCLWMSIRYCVGSHTIATHSHAGNIWANYKNRLCDGERSDLAYDIDKEMKSTLNFIKPKFNFFQYDIWRHGTCIDMVCEFMQEYNIKSKEEFLGYKEVKVIPTDNERGYKFETITWEEWLREEVHKKLIDHYMNNSFTYEQTWGIFEKWRNTGEAPYQEVEQIFKDITKPLPNSEYFFMSDFENLFVWNDLCHMLLTSTHHKSVLIDNSEIEWVYTWTYKKEKIEEKENIITYRRTFGYEKIKCPVNTWDGIRSAYVPDDIIKKDLY